MNMFLVDAVSDKIKMFLVDAVSDVFEKPTSDTHDMYSKKTPSKLDPNNFMPYGFLSPGSLSI
jgi:hypothetical protein